MSCLFSIFSSSKNQTKKRPKLPTFDLEEEPKPTFCVYDSDDSDIENNNVQKFDVQTIKYYECCLGKGKICKQSQLLFSVIYFLTQKNFLFSPLADTFFANVTMMEEKTLHFVPQSSYPRIRHKSSDVVFNHNKLSIFYSQ